MAYLAQGARPRGGLATSLLLAGALVAQLSQCIKFSVGIEHDLSGPTYGLEGKSGSRLNYDERQGLKLGGTLADLLGPPIKIANGLGSVFHGNNLAGMGAGLRSGGALLGFDAKMLEAAGAAHLLKGGLKWRGLEAAQLGAGAKGGQQLVEQQQVPLGAQPSSKGGQQLAEQQQQQQQQVPLSAQPSSKGAQLGQLLATKGRKIGSVLEVPIRVVAMKELAGGGALAGAGHLKAAQAQAIDSKGQALEAQGQALKAHGLSQIVQGASEGVHNIGNLFHKTSDNVNSAIKLLPLVWDMQVQEAQEAQQEAAAKGQQQQQQQQAHAPQLLSTPHQLGAAQPGSLSGGSLFGGLSSLLPNLSAPQHHEPSYAAMWNSTNPLTSLLMSPHSNPFLMPLTSGPLGQAWQAKQPALDNSQSASYNFNLLPGLKYSEHISSSATPLLKKKLIAAPSKLAHEQQQPIIQQQLEQRVEQQQPQQLAKP